MTKSRGILPPRRPWTDADLALLTERYPDQRAEDIAAALGCSVQRVYSKAQKLGLCKSEAFLASEASGRLDGVKGSETRFKPGDVPWSKGMKGLDMGGRSAETRFRSGDKPFNHVPVGSLRVATIGYLQIKLTETGYPPRDWVMYHRHIWEQANGPIPDGHIVVFKPGCRTTKAEEITPDRLECISKQEHISRHTFHQYGPEIAGVVQLRGALTRQINRRLKESEPQ